jgi:hypothetical protein
MLVKVAKEEEAECSLNNPTVANNLTVVAGSHLTANQRCVQHFISPLKNYSSNKQNCFRFIGADATPSSFARRQKQKQKQRQRSAAANGK